MGVKIIKWIRNYYSKIAGSIAFFPAIIAICFLLLSWAMLEIDFSPWGKNLKQQLSWLSLKDATTARSIISTVAGAIISLTVFSFSMVMIVLNQAASQMSNRVLSSMIENRFQQIVLGFYIGTIVYALFLLSTIRDINSGVYVPALSIYLLIVLTVIDIFLFIYFLDYVTQTVKYETVIRRVQTQTLDAMEEKFCEIEVDTDKWNEKESIEISSKVSGYFQDFDEKQLLEIAREENVFISFRHKKGSYIIKGNTLVTVYGKSTIEDDCKSKLLTTMNFLNGQPIERNPEYGFHQLTEIALKALSPGINDPATAVISLNALTDLFAYRLYHCLPVVLKDKQGAPRIRVRIDSFADLFEYCVYPVWDYGKKDRYIQMSILGMIDQLKKIDKEEIYLDVFNRLAVIVRTEMQNNILN